MIIELQSLRGLFIFFIFLHHLSVFPAGGDWGVSFFIILSGFVLSLGYGERAISGRLPVLPFVRRRLSKIYPLHLICLLLGALFLTRKFAPGLFKVWGLNMVLLQAWVPDENIYFSGNPVAWYLSCFLFFYFVFPWVVPLVSRMRLWAAALLVALYFAAVNLVPEHLMVGLIYINPAFRVFDFLLGILLWRVWKQMEPQTAFRSRSVTAKSLVELAVVGLSVVWVVVYPAVAQRYGMASYWWPINLLIVFIFASFSGSGGIISRMLRWQPLVWFGNRSFAFYMTHYLVIHMLFHIMDYAPFAAVAVLSFTVAVIISAIWHFCAEKFR